MGNGAGRWVGGGGESISLQSLLVSPAHIKGCRKEKGQPQNTQITMNKLRFVHKAIAR